MVKSSFIAVLVLVILFGLLSSTSAAPIAKVVTGVVSNAVSALLKWLWSLKSTTKPSKGNQFSVKHSRPMMKFESGYTVETIFDGSKLGIEPYSVEVSSNGEFLVLDSENSNIYKIPGPVSTYSKPKILAGSPEGYTGHIDGRPREARMNHPKGIAVDERGNVYIADTMNMAIRKISDEAGVTTIAGGKRGQIGGHVDGAGEDAKFSNDFDLVYAASSCSLLVVDRGNLAIREIQLHHHDCTTYRHQQDEDEEDDVSFHLGIAVLVAAGFFGYMLALLHWRIKAMFSSADDPRAYGIRKGMPAATSQQKPSPPKSVRPPLIPNEEEYEKEDEGFFRSIGRLFVYSGSAFVEIFGSLFSASSRSKRKSPHYHQYQQQMMNRHSNTWPVQDSFVIPDEDEPPPPCLETKTPNPRETYPYMSQKDLEMPHQQPLNPRRGAYLSNRWDGECDQQIQRQGKQQQQQILQKHYSSSPHQSYYDQNCEANEIVFGAVQEQDGRRETMVIKAVDYGDPKYNHRNLRPRLNYVGYSQGY